MTREGEAMNHGDTRTEGQRVLQLLPTPKPFVTSAQKHDPRLLLFRRRQAEPTNSMGWRPGYCKEGSLFQAAHQLF